MRCTDRASRFASRCSVLLTSSDSTASESWSLTPEARSQHARRLAHSVTFCVPGGGSVMTSCMAFAIDTSWSLRPDEILLLDQIEYVSRVSLGACSRIICASLLMAYVTTFAR